jgi:hypothetical protein
LSKRANDPFADPFDLSEDQAEEERPFKRAAMYLVLLTEEVTCRGCGAQSERFSLFTSDFIQSGSFTASPASLSYPRRTKFKSSTVLVCPECFGTDGVEAII